MAFSPATGHSLPVTRYGHSFRFAWPRRNRGNDNPQGRSPCGPELKMGAERDRKPSPGFQRNDGLRCPLLAPNLTPALDHHPQFLHSAMPDRVGDLAGWERTFHHAGARHSASDPDLRPIGGQEVTLLRNGSLFHLRPSLSGPFTGVLIPWWWHFHRILFAVEQSEQCNSRHEHEGDSAVDLVCGMPEEPRAEPNGSHLDWKKQRGVPKDFLGKCASPPKTDRRSSIENRIVQDQVRPVNC